MPQSNAVMLPGNVSPSRYDLRLVPDLDGFTFRGEETVEIEVLEPTSDIVLNAAELTVESCELILGDGTVLSPRSTHLSDADETATFAFDRTLPAGQARLAVRFKGELNDMLRGFYRSRYADGHERYLASTQFEATDARRAFPCWDEPALKARFKVTLEVPSDLVAISNMPIASERDAGQSRKTVEFAESPPMSTYLVAFVVGHMRSVEQRTPDGTLMRVWTTAGKEEQGRYALDVSVRLLAYFNDYFGVPYPLDKLDHIAIPDFAAGAMENWGAITYREIALLVDPRHSSAGTRQRVASIVAHEMAHMWFGDLVTMAWWNDLWLNESFASWMGDSAVDHLHPEWQMWTQFIAADTAHALSLDGLANSHPIEQQVSDPGEISELFDAISYSKGGSILRMLDHFIGAEDFRTGLRQYIRDHAYGNARTRDLWSALGAASNQPVVDMMDSWVQQTGYPVVDVNVTPTEDSITVDASQHRFLYEQVAGQAGSDDTLWHVPLSITAAARREPTAMLMEARETTLAVPLPTASGKGWAKVNPEQTGFYRVNYDPEHWGRLVEPIKNLELAASDRLGIQNDAYALSKAGLLPVTQFLELAEAYANETDASVWSDLSSNLRNLDTLLGDEPYYDEFEAFARNVFQPAGERVGWDAGPDEGHLDALLRSSVLAGLGRYRDRTALAEAGRRFVSYLEDMDSVHPDVRTPVLSLAAKSGNDSTYDRMWDVYRRVDLEEEKVRVLRALTEFEQPELLIETLDRSLTDEVRVHDTVSVIAGVASGRRGRDLAWQFMKSNWPELDRRYGKGGFALMRLVHVASRFTSPDMLVDIEQFFGSHPPAGAERTLQQALEQVRLNIAWLDANHQQLADWFAQR